MSKHTQGEWIIADENNQCCEVLLGSTHNLTCSLNRQDNNTGEFVIERDEMLSNARLIAAAPELLDALRLLLNDSDEHFTLQGRRYLARAAIAKATGETPP